MVVLSWSQLGCNTPSARAARARDAIGVEPTKVIEGQYTRVHCFFDNAPACALVGDVAEKSYSEAIKFLGAPAAAADDKIEIEVVTDIKQLDAAWDAEHSPSDTVRPTDQQGGFENAGANAAYVNCTSCGSGSRVQLSSDRATVAREVLLLTNQLRISTGAAKPHWLQEGSAIYFANQYLRTRGEFTTDEDDVRESGHIHLLQETAQANQLPSLDDVIHDNVGAVPVPVRDAYLGEFYRFMSEGPRKDAFTKFLATLQTTPPPDYTKHVTEAFVQSFDLAAVDKEFREHITQLTPHWSRNARSLDTLGPVWNTFGSDHTSSIWRESEPSLSQFEVSGEVSVIAVPKARVQLLLGGADHKPCVQVEFIQGKGVVVAEMQNGKWTHPAEAALPNGFAPNGFTPLKVRNTGTQLEVEVADQKLTAKPQCDLTTTWGVGVSPGSAGAWRNLERKPINGVTPGAATPASATPAPSDSTTTPSDTAE